MRDDGQEAVLEAVAVDALCTPHILFGFKFVLPFKVWVLWALGPLQRKGSGHHQQPADQRLEALELMGSLHARGSFSGCTPRPIMSSTLGVVGGPDQRS